MQPQPNFPLGPSPFPPSAPGRVPVISASEYPGAWFLPDVNETAVPFVAPTSGGFLYSVGDALAYRNASGEHIIPGSGGGSPDFSEDIIVNGVRIGQGVSAVPSSLVIGNGAAALNTVGGTENVVVGTNALAIAVNFITSVVVGSSAMADANNGGGVVAIGAGAYQNTRFPNNSVAVGIDASKNGDGYDQCTAVGAFALDGVAAGEYSQVSALGYQAFAALIDGATGGVALGAYAGRYETAAHAFYLNDKNQGDTATEKLNSLLYGRFGATAADQMFTINALQVIMPYLPTAAAGLATGQLWNNLGILNVA